MGSAQRPARPAPSSGLVPATRQEFAVHLTACLALVAPAGMTEESRREWLRVAWDTLGHLPSDILERACRVARQKCDHPAKIVPTVLDAAAESMRVRREAARYESDLPRLPRPAYCTPAEAAQILKEYGLK